MRSISPQITVLSFLICLILPQMGCAPRIPQAAQPTAAFPSSIERTDLIPIGVEISPDVILEADSRGWYWWQANVNTAADAILWPLRVSVSALLAPVALPLCMSTEAYNESYIQQVVQEIKLVENLRSSVVEELRNINGPSNVAAAEQKGGGLPGSQTSASYSSSTRFHSILTLDKIKVYLDNGTVYKETGTGHSFTLILHSRWSLRKLSGREESVSFEVVTVRPCKVQMVDIPLELFLALDGHAKRIVHKLKPPRNIEK
ncbi:hypothetical protein [Geomonas terrae]|nr:hypothetical protein [Geomonas terrae]